MKRVTGLALLVLLMMSVSPSAAATLTPGMSTQILTATPARTVVAVEFDAATVAQRLTSPMDGAQPTDGFGSVLAIAGHGTPSAHVLQYELGDAIHLSSALDDANIAVQPDELVVVGEPAIWHDLRVVGVGYRPVMRDANGDLRAVTSLQVEVTTTGGGGINPHPDPTCFSSAFLPAYREIVANLDDLYPALETRPPGRMLVITATQLFGEMDGTPPLMNWLDLKNRKGYDVQLATRYMIWQSVGDSSRIGIKQYIQQAYDNAGERDLEYVVILADAPEGQSQDGPVYVPTWWVANPESPTEIKPGDNPYVCVAGDDYLPDIFIGRVSGATSTDISVYLAKVYRYETDPFVSDPAWFEKGTFVAGNFSDTGGYPVTPVWNTEWARVQMMQDGCITLFDTCYYSGPNDPDPPGWCWPNVIRPSINGGTSMIVYRGWAAQDRWWYPLVTRTQVLNEVVCGRRNPALFSIVCGTGDFAWSGGMSFGEAFVFGLGSVSASNGAIVFFGASDVHTNTRHNNAILAGMVDAMKAAGERSTGPLAIAGKMEAYRQFPLERDNGWIQYFVFHVFNVLGDPETQLTICQPGALDVAYPSSLTPGTETVDFAVTSGGQPIEGAVVTLRAGQTGTVVRALTDAGGHAWLSADLSGATVAQVTVWKDRYFLRQIDIPVVSSPYDPSITSVNWQDGNDNLPNPGETVPFTLTVQNLGTNATDLAATVTSQDPRVTIVNGSGTFGTIQPGQSATSTQMSIHLGDGLMDGELPRLNVLLAGNGSVTRVTEVPVTAPWARMTQLSVNDGNNGILEPGEQATVSVTIQNTGHQNAGNLTAVVYSWDSAISFQDAGLGWGAVAVGQQVNSSDHFVLTLASGVTPGRQILLRYDIYNNGTLLGSTGQWLTAGVVTIHAPTGPEAYGYYAYEDIDAGYSATPTYNWVELDPAHGGNGAQAHEVHDDTYFHLNLPQPFRFYGQAYDTLFICSNGWFAFERPMFAEFQNWELPFRMAPWLMVCPYWDDLIGDTTLPNDTNFAWTVWSRWDTNPDRLTLMWRGYHRAGLTGGGNIAPEVFEAVLEYNGQNDGSILMQYNQVTQVLGTNTNPSNYSTVGIQNFYQRTGLTVSFANRYPPSVDSLRTGRAIRFTTTPPDNFTGVNDPPSVTIPTHYALHEAYPNPFNPTTELRYDLPEAARVSLIVYDMLGRERMTLVDDFRAAGSYQVTFDGNRLPSGLYFARMTAGSFAQVRKLLLVK